MQFLKRLWSKIKGGSLPILLAGFVLSVAMGALYIYQPFVLRALDNKVYDALLRQTYTNSTTGVPVIIDLDERALAEYGQFPWPRYRVGLLLEKVKRAGALGIGLDSLFAEPDRTSPRVLREVLKRDLQVSMGFTGLPEALMDNDQVFASILGGGPFVLGYFMNFSEEVADKDRQCKLHPLRAAVLKTPGTPEATKFLFSASEAVCNLIELSTAAPSSGFYNTVPDEDGIVRRTPMIIEYNGEIYPSLSLATLMQATGVKQAVLKITPGGVESLRIGPTVIPLDFKGQLLLNYRGKGGAFEYISAADILAGKYPAGSLKGRIAFLGTSAAGLKDIRATPFDPLFPGVEAHTTAVDNILSKDFIQRPDWAPGLELITVLVAGILSTFLLTWARATWSLVPLAACGTGMWFAAVWCLGDKGLYVSPLIPMVTLGLNFTLLTLLKFWREEGHKKFLHATFASYLSPELIDQMVESNEMPELGGEARIITAYFTDIQGFSSFSEILTAHQLVELLNEYLSVQTDILIAEGGTLDKYEGDAIIAFFGAPMEMPDNPLRACKVAVDMQNALLELREKWRQEKRDPEDTSRNTKNLPPERWGPEDKWPDLVHNMLMRIGVNTGEIVVGNMGSAIRMNYTMMGDSVNLAARLEEAAKQYGVYTMVSMFTMEQDIEMPDGSMTTVADQVETRFLDNIQVVGKEEPVKVYELVAMKGGLTEKETQLFEVFNKGMNHYLNTEWDEAIACFQEALPMERVPEGKTTPSEVFMKRAQNYKENPPVAPGEKWDGVYRLTKK